jgi:hypothetical protein
LSDLSPAAQYNSLGQIFVFANKVVDADAQRIVTKAIYHRIHLHLCESGDNLDEEGFVELGGMISDIWGVAAPDAPIRRLLVDAIYAFKWVRNENGYVLPTAKAKQQDMLIRCFQFAPAEFLAQAAVRLLDRSEYKKYDGLNPNFVLENYL